MKHKTFDVIVAGAGMIGLTAAKAFADQGFSVALVDPNDPRKLDRQGCQRVSAIAESSRSLLECIGAWEHIANQDKTPYLSMSIWDGQGQGKIEFSSASLPACQQLGHIVFNSAIQQAITAQLVKAKAVSFFPFAIETMASSNDENHLMLENTNELSAKLVVAADGAHSKLRQLAKIQSDEKAYGNAAIVATIALEKSHDCCAYQVYHETPLAFLPLADTNTCSIVWSVKDSEKDRLITLDEEKFCRLLELNMEGRFGNIRLLSPRQAFPLIKRHSQHYIAERLALVGDAKQTLHPMAGLGANIGFSDIESLIRIITSRQLEDPGEARALRAYQRERRIPTQKALTLMDTLQFLFANDTMTVQLLRNWGLNWVNQQDWLKRQLIDQAGSGAMAT